MLILVIISALFNFYLNIIYISSNIFIEFPKFSMVAGDFVQIYNSKDQIGQWDAIVTCFFIDTAPNIIE